MRKYFQITVVLSIFGLLVFFRNSKRGDEQNSINNPSLPIPPPITSVQQPTSPSQSQNSQTTQTAQATPTVLPTETTGLYKNGTYDGSIEDAYYGNIQVQVTISGGKLTDVVFLQYPNDNHTSISINSQAMPILRSEAIQAQNAQVDGVSGASDTSAAFIKSLSSALQKAS